MPKILYFTAEWCAPCRRFGPLLTAEAEARGLPVARLDVDNPAAWSAVVAYGVQTVPTVVIERDDEVVDQFGAVGVMALRERLDAACGR